MANPMQDQRERERARIDGRASFAGAAFLTGVGLIYLLERVGAPAGLVRALGPLFALAALGLLGVLTRATRMPTFFTADRAIPAAYAGLGSAATAAGFTLCLAAPGRSPLPLAGVAAGVALNALVVSPLLRATHASGLADLLATRFPSTPLRLLVAMLLATIGALVAAAGVAAATDAIVALFEPARAAAATIVAAVVLLTVAPGGLAGLVWGAAASAGMILMILTLPIAAQLLSGDPALPALARGGALVGQTLTPLWSVGAAADVLVALATGLAVGALAPLTTAAIACSGERQAFRAGLFGVAFAALIALAALLDLGMGEPTGPMAAGLRATAVVLGALVLAGAGAQAATRAWGARMTGLRHRWAPLASQRLARSRVAMIAVVGGCALLTARTAVNPGVALQLAAALSVGLAAPLIALALFSRATSAHAAAGAVASLASGLFLLILGGGFPDPGRLMICALASGATGFAVGWAGAVFARDAGEPPRPRHDLFVDAPFDPGA
jgi:cation/acetate symporter